MIASFTMEGERELTCWVDPSRWGCGIASWAAGVGKEVVEHIYRLDEGGRPARPVV